MSATDDDTELRDLLIQNLENNGVLNKLKAEMRAAVFLAMEEQDKLENKTPLINENLRKCLNTKDGRLVASLIVDFLQVFNLDFTLAVFQPEINSLNGLDGRDLVCRDLGLSESEVNRNCPVLLELVRRGRVRDKSVCSEEPSQRQIAHAHKKYEFYDKEHSGSVSKDNVKNAFMDLLPGLNRNMLERFISDELRAADKTSSTAIDLQLFLEMYRRLFAQCRSVVVQDPDVGPPPEKKISSPHISKIPRFKGHRLRGQSETTAKFPCGPQDSDHVTSLGKGDSSPSLNRDRLDLDLEAEQDLDDGDSFFDDPLPKPQKTYGCVPLREECQAAPVVSTMRRDKSLNDLSVLAEGERDLPLSEHSQSSELRKVESSGARESPAGSQSEAPRPGGGGVGSSASESICSRSGASESREKESPDPQDLRDPQVPRDKPGSVQLDDDVEYDDDFNSHRSDFSRSELSIGEEIEEVSIEGPDTSDKLDDTTQDLSVSQLSQSHGADYMEEVA